MKFGRSAKRLGFESLEAKRMLTGNNFDVAVVGGDLVITGDAGRNQFDLTDGTWHGSQYRINQLGAPDDTINGSVVDFVDVSGVTGNIIINMGDGDDEVILRADPLAIPGSVLTIDNDVLINTGAGNDMIIFGRFENPAVTDVSPVDIGGDLRMFGGADDDYVEMTAFNVAGDLTYYDAQGNNFIQFLPNSESITNIVGDDLRVITGSGSDGVGLYVVDVGDDVLIATDGGDDVVDVQEFDAGGAITVSLGTGYNEAFFTFVDAGYAFSLLGQGTNVVSLDSVTAGCFITIVTCSEDDTIDLINTQATSALVSTGGGADQVYIGSGSEFDYLLVEMGSGDDSLTFDGVTVNRWALLSGGRGDDVFTELGSNDINWQLAWSF